MWRDNLRDFLDFPILMNSLCAPLSRSMVEHLILLEYQPYRRAVVSSWPAKEVVWQRVLERVVSARADVCEFMDTFVQDDIIKAKEGQEREFPNDRWVLEQLQVYAPENVKVTKKALEDWQSRNILRKEYPGSSLWRLDDVAALLIMRLVNTTHQKGWLPSEIPENEPRWWCYGKSAPDSSTIPVPIPLQGGDDSTPLLLWTPRIGASWAPDWQRHYGMSVRWSRHFNDTKELAVWHNNYAQEIKQAAHQAVELSQIALHASREGVLLSYKEVQTALKTSIEEAIQHVQVTMRRKAEQLILEEQTRLLVSKEK